MILSPLSRQQTALRICRPLIQTQSLYYPKTQRRRIHQLPQLTHIDAFTRDGITRNGEPGLLSADGFDMAWHQYQGLLVDRLTKLTTDTPYANTPTRDLTIALARQPDYASLFNYASMAWSNHQFFSTLSPTPPKMSPNFTSHINNSFSSVDSLRATFIATANAMFGPGFVWLVRHKNRNPHLMENELSILTTYLAGSPLPGAHYRKQEVDLNTMMAAGSFGSAALLTRKENKLAYGGADLDILLSVNTWEHVWLRDWGIGGKKAFLEEWWRAIDWDVVEASYQTAINQETAEKKKFLPMQNPLRGVENVGRRRQQTPGRFPY